MWASQHILEISSMKYFIYTHIYIHIHIYIYIWLKIKLSFSWYFQNTFTTGFPPCRVILCMRPTNERWRYNVTSSRIDCAHTQKDSPPLGKLQHKPINTKLVTGVKYNHIPSHMTSKQSDVWRLMQISWNLVRPEHPFELSNSRERSTAVILLCSG